MCVYRVFCLFICFLLWLSTHLQLCCFFFFYSRDFVTLTCTAFLQSWWRLMLHLSTAYQLLKLRQGSTRNSDGWQSFSVSACQKIEETHGFTWVYRKLLAFSLQLQRALVTEAKFDNCFIFIWKFAGSFLVIWQQKTKGVASEKAPVLAEANTSL